MKRYRVLLAIGFLILMVFSLPAGALGGTSALIAPVLVSPTNTSTIVTPTFTWQSVEDASKYQIQVATSDSFTTVLFDADTDDLTITPVSTLPNDVMFWHVRAKELAEQSRTLELNLELYENDPCAGFISPGEWIDDRYPGFFLERI